MADAGYKLDTNSTSGADAFGGTAMGGSTGAFTVNQSKTAIPQWVWIAAAALAALFIWRSTGKRK